MMKDEDELLEQQYGELTRREERQERKKARSRDRSKFKKSDWDKREKVAVPPPDDPSLKEGRVVNLVPEGATVACEGSERFCVLRGALKKERTKDKNLLAVGDLVRFLEADGDEGLIVYVEPRSSVLARADTLSQRRQQILAANVEQVFITTSVLTPPLKPNLVDRYIIAAEKGGLQPIVLINKVDLLNEEEKQIYEDMLEGYAAIDMPVLSVSTVTGQGVDELRELMRGKVSVFSGQSGVGKSSLINAVTGLDLATRETVHRSRKGAHTTTQAILLPLLFGGWCVDTPGVQSFGVWDLGIDEVRGYYREFAEYAADCRYGSCTHMHEPDCAVLDAVEAGRLSALRYDSYVQLVESIAAGHKRR